MKCFTPNGSDKTREINKWKTRSSRLKALKNDVAIVSEKLNKLKIQLINSVPRRIIEEQIACSKILRNLKKKSEFLDENTLENQSREFENLKQILEDAKKLNAKLQNIKIEKRKMGKIKMGRQTVDADECNFVTKTEKPSLPQ